MDFDKTELCKDLIPILVMVLPRHCRYLLAIKFTMNYLNPTTICHFACCIKLKVKLFFIHYFWRRLLTRIILLAGHTSGRLSDFITVSKFTGFLAEFGYGKYLIVHF